jgi:hypothetical protein
MAERLKRYSTSFKVILILIALIAAGYIFKLSTGTKQIILANTDSIAAIHPQKKHKRKHKLKSVAPITATPKPVVDTPKVAVIKAVPVKSEQVMPAVIPIKPAPVKHLPDSNKSTFLYTTYVQPNVTGIVKLREQDNFYSNTIADIPANSKVQVLQKGTTYYRVAYNNNIGFVPKWALQTK